MKSYWLQNEVNETRGKALDGKVRLRLEKRSKGGCGAESSERLSFLWEIAMEQVHPQELRLYLQKPIEEQASQNFKMDSRGSHKAPTLVEELLAVAISCGMCGNW